MVASWVFADNESTALSAAVVTTPAALTQETWTVTSTSVVPTVVTGVTQFAALLHPANSSDPFPEIVLVINTVDSTHLQVLRGYGGTIKTHSVGDVLAVAVDSAWFNKVEGSAEEYSAITTTTAAPNINLTNGLNLDWNLQANATGPVLNTTGIAVNIPYRFTIKVIQDAVGSRTISWPTTIRWAGSTIPTLSTSPGSIDVFSFVSYDGGTSFDGFVVGINMLGPVTNPSTSSFYLPFTTASPWNTVIKPQATFSTSSDPRTTNLRSASGYINCEAWSHPIYQSINTDTTFTVHTFVSNTTHAQTDVSYKIPTGAQPSQPPFGAIGGADAHMHVITPDGVVHESYLMRQNADTTWSNQNYAASMNISGTGIGAGSVRVSGATAIGGIIRAWEVNAGAINHVLALSLQYNQLKTGFVWPAISEDIGSTTSTSTTYYTGQIPIGTLVAIPSVAKGGPNLSTLGLSPQGLMLATALQKYGAYVVDSGSCVLMAEPTGGIDLSAINAMRNDSSKIFNQLCLVTNNSSSTIGGGP